MSWWETGQDEDVIGDRPADLARRALRQLVETREAKGQEKPALADLLGALALVVAGPAGQELSLVPAGPPRIVADMPTGGPIAGVPPRADAGTSNLLEPLTESLHAIAETYQDRWARKPRLSEWLQAFEFVLRYRPEDFLLDGTDHPPVRIRAE